MALAVAAVTPALLLFSQSRLQDAASAFDKGDCTIAVRDARSSINALAVRPEPYQIMGYCDLEEGRPHEAIAAFKKAIQEEPRSWEYRYGVGVARAATGLDPTAALRAAYVRDPRETLITDAINQFRSSPRSQWPEVSDRLRGDAIQSGRLSLK